MSKALVMTAWVLAYFVIWLLIAAFSGLSLDWLTIGQAAAATVVFAGGFWIAGKWL